MRACVCVHAQIIVDVPAARQLRDSPRSLQVEICHSHDDAHKFALVVVLAHVRNLFAAAVRTDDSHVDQGSSDTSSSVSSLPSSFSLTLPVPRPSPLIPPSPPPPSFSCSLPAPHSILPPTPPSSQVTRQHNEDCRKLLRLMGVPVIEVKATAHRMAWNCSPYCGR